MADARRRPVHEIYNPSIYMTLPTVDRSFAMPVQDKGSEVQTMALSTIVMVT